MGIIAYPDTIDARQHLLAGRFALGRSNRRQTVERLRNHRAKTTLWRA